MLPLLREKLHDKTTSNDTKERYLNLQSFHVEYIVESVKKYNKEIKNPKRFLEKTLERRFLRGSCYGESFFYNISIPRIRSLLILRKSSEMGHFVLQYLPDFDKI